VDKMKKIRYTSPGGFFHLSMNGEIYLLLVEVGRVGLHVEHSKKTRIARRGRRLGPIRAKGE